MLLRRDRAFVAIDVVLDVAFHAGRGPETTGAAEIAERLSAQRRGIEPVLQALCRAGILDSVRGPKGGYRLGRAARSTPLIDVVAAVADRDTSADTPTSSRLTAAVTEPLWQVLDARLRAAMAEQTVADLLRQAAKAGLKVPRTEPIDFAI